MDKDRKNELIVGSFTALALLTLVTMIFMLNGLQCGQGEDEYQVRFLYVANLEPQAPVYFAGYKVGKVREIILNTDDTEPVLVRFVVPRSIKLRRDVLATIEMSGLVGQMNISLMPVGDTEPYLTARDVIDGSEPMMFSSIITMIKEKGGSIADQTQVVLESVNRLLSDNAVQDDFKTTISNAADASAKADALLASLQAVVNENRGGVRNTVANVSDVSGDLRQIAGNIDRTVVAVRLLSENVNGMTGENRENIQKLLANLTTTSEHFKAFSADIEANPWKLLRKP